MSVVESISCVDVAVALNHSDYRGMVSAGMTPFIFGFTTCALFMCAAGPTAASVPEGSNRHANVLLINPLPLIVGFAAAQLTDEVERAYPVNLRYHRRLRDGLAFTLSPAISTARVLTIDFYSVGLKLGPRLSAAGRGLEEWYLTPLIVMARTWATQGRHSLSSALSAGAGFESGYAWHWKRLALELGAGAYYSAYLGHSSFDGNPAPPVGHRLLLNLGVGYGW